MVHRYTVESVVVGHAAREVRGPITEVSYGNVVEACSERGQTKHAGRIGRRVRRFHAVASLGSNGRGRDRPAVRTRHRACNRTQLSERSRRVRKKQQADERCAQTTWTKRRGRRRHHDPYLIPSTTVRKCWWIIAA